MLHYRPKELSWANLGVGAAGAIYSIISLKKKVILFLSFLEYNLHLSWRYYLKTAVLGIDFNFLIYL